MHQLIYQLVFSFTEIVEVEYPGQFKKELWQMSEGEKQDAVPDLHQSGNRLYREEKLKEASECYAKALGLMEQMLTRYDFSCKYYRIESRRLSFVFPIGAIHKISNTLHGWVNHRGSDPVPSETGFGPAKPPPPL